MNSVTILSYASVESELLLWEVQACETLSAELRSEKPKLTHPPAYLIIRFTFV